MCCSPLILLLITGALLIPTEAQANYHGLSDKDKSIVDMAIKHGNKIPEKPQWHMNFLCFEKRTQTSNFLSTEILLRADCKNTHQKGCSMGIINCRVCTDDLTHLETSFIHCDWRRNVHKHAELRENGCKTYGLGGSTLLAVKGQTKKMDPASECLGCL